MSNKLKLCARCGDCCLKYPCGIGRMFFGEEITSCSALEHDEDATYTCGLVAHPSHYVDLGESAAWKDEWLGRMIAAMLGIGRGCCSSPFQEMVAAQMRVARLARRGAA